jgi:hypothetical protein
LITIKVGNQKVKIFRFPEFSPGEGNSGAAPEIAIVVSQHLVVEPTED